MKIPRKHSGLWVYLDQAGVLERGSPEDIAEAKRAYWKRYHYDHRRSQRKEKPEFVVSLCRSDGTYTRIAAAAKRHKLTIPAYLRTAALAYLDQAFIVPNPEHLAHLEQLLSQCANEVQALAGAKEKYFWQRDEKIAVIEKRIERLEREVAELFRHPPSLEVYIRRAIKQSPEIKAQLQSLLLSL